MTDRLLPGRLLLVERLSPVPVVDRDGRFLIEGDDPQEALTLGTFNETYDSTGVGYIRSERSWPTRRCAVAESYAAEFERVLGFVRALSDEVCVVTSTPPRSVHPVVVFAEPSPVPGSGPRSAGGRLRRLLIDAVRATGGADGPAGSGIVDAERWLERLDQHLPVEALRPDERLVVGPAFLPAVTERLRTRDSGARRQMIRADLGLPTDPEAYRSAVARLTAEAGDITTRLGDAFATPGLAGYRQGARAVLDLQAAYPREDGGVLLQLLFTRGDAGEPFTIPVLGLHIPPPAQGYPLLLTDGRTEMLSRPPWQLGWSVMPEDNT
ncbi:hypothetical protein ACI1MP_31065 [Kitasatospora griseola]|uniref:hypothetical protein n=1 Tax=Kitasatospora griseola TaxID=2064 RepID=UPI003855E3A7